MNPSMKFRRLLYILLPLAAFVLLSACKNNEGSAAQKKSPPKFPVEIAIAQARNVAFTVSAVGSIEAFEIVQVTARVPGVLERVLFKEGDRVNAGQPLVEIEPERYTLAVRSAQAQLDKTTAELQVAQIGLERREELNRKNPDLVKQEEIDDWRTRVSTAKATQAQAEAALRTAELNLTDAHAPAPLAGEIQTRNVQTGQYLQAGAVIATLVRRDPMMLRFAVPEIDASRIRKGQEVLFTVRGGGGEYQAVITAVAGSANDTTRLVSIAAEVNDPARAELRPGSFAEVTVNLGERSELPVIPQTAIRPSQKGFLGFVIEDSTAHERILTLGSRTSDGYVEVTNGLNPGEQVVIRGAEALRDGAGVRIAPSGQTRRDSLAVDTAASGKANQ